MTDAEYKAHQEKIKPFQAAIDLVTLADLCILFDWDVPHSTGLTRPYKIDHMHARFLEKHKKKVEEILARHGINGGEWRIDTSWEGKNNPHAEFILPTPEAEQYPMLKSMRAVKLEAGKTSATNLVLQLATLMPNQK